MHIISDTNIGGAGKTLTLGTLTLQNGYSFTEGGAVKEYPF